MVAGGSVEVAAAGGVPGLGVVGTVGLVDNDGVGLRPGDVVAGEVRGADSDGSTVVGLGVTVAGGVLTGMLVGVGSGVDGTAVDVGSVGSGTTAATAPPIPGKANAPNHTSIPTAITRLLGEKVVSPRSIMGQPSAR
jgi:hypothetical protein